jgi:hypothetical protein
MNKIDFGGRTLTIENLKRIHDAMAQIEPIDQSNAFKLYFDEVKQRIHQLT